MHDYRRTRRARRRTGCGRRSTRTRRLLRSLNKRCCRGRLRNRLPADLRLHQTMNQQLVGGSEWASSSAPSPHRRHAPPSTPLASLPPAASASAAAAALGWRIQARTIGSTNWHRRSPRAQPAASSRPQCCLCRAAYSPKNASNGRLAPSLFDGSLSRTHVFFANCTSPDRTKNLDHRKIYGYLKRSSRQFSTVRGPLGPPRGLPCAHIVGVHLAYRPADRSSGRWRRRRVRHRGKAHRRTHQAVAPQEVHGGLVELGRHTGLSASFLSQLETGRVVPTLRNRRAHRHGIRQGPQLANFDPEPRTPLFRIHRGKDRIRMPQSGVDDPCYFFESLGYLVPDRQLDPYFAEFPRPPRPAANHAPISITAVSSYTSSPAPSPSATAKPCTRPARATQSTSMPPPSTKRYECSGAEPCSALIAVHPAATGGDPQQRPAHRIDRSGDGPSQPPAAPRLLLPPRRSNPRPPPPSPKLAERRPFALVALCEVRGIELGAS